MAKRDGRVLASLRDVHTTARCVHETLRARQIQTHVDGAHWVGWTVFPPKRGSRIASCPDCGALELARLWSLQVVTVRVTAVRDVMQRVHIRYIRGNSYLHACVVSGDLLEQSALRMNVHITRRYLKYVDHCLPPDVGSYPRVICYRLAAMPGRGGCDGQMRKWHSTRFKKHPQSHVP
eukprot:5152628-Pyramimonas_sp.AAC.3